jgi:hypothetical protein
MKKLRKTTPGKRKQERKNAEEEMQRKVALFAQHPTDCCVCKTVFERTKETVLTWQVTINENRVRLTCPDCWGIINQALENNK